MEVDVRVYADHIEVYYKGHLVESMERIHGAGEARIDYRHIIGSLVRKPGAFARYRFREQMMLLVSWFWRVTGGSGAADRMLLGHGRPFYSEGRRTRTGVEPAQLHGPTKPAYCKEGPVAGRRCSWSRNGSS